MLTTDKLGDLQDSDRLSAECRSCNHHAWIETQPLIEKYGPAFKWADIAKFLYCDKCKSKDVNLRKIPNSRNDY